jgi:ABC-2 type transport system permease protein
MIRGHVVRAVFLRNFRSYFSTPTGYVFIILFIVLSAAAAFWPDRFFDKNLANLDTLNDLFPFLLLFFVPAITMGLWAEERKQGTDELLLTLPARDFELVLGKYLAGLGIYTVALGFSLFHVAALLFLGRPDLGVMIGTYAGYWFLGAGLLAVGSVASLLTSNMTVAFILGALFCALGVLFGYTGVIVGGPVAAALEALGSLEPFRDFTSGLASLTAAAYFVGLVVLMLYLNLVLLARRHVREAGQWGHLWARAACILVAAVSLGVIGTRVGWRLDLTQERLHSLTAATRDVLGRIDASRPVLIQAFVSPEVPPPYVQTRETLLGLLRQYEAYAGGKIQLRVVAAEPYTAEAREASDKGIRPERAAETEEGRRGRDEIFMGIHFSCGPEEVVVPFMDRGLPVEYELTRSVGTVSGTRRKRVGVATTDVKLFGGFDFQAMSSEPAWSILEELRKQYKVDQVALDQPVTEKYDVLIVVMPSTLAQPQMDNLLAYVRQGNPALFLDDPLPFFNPSMAPSEPRRPPQRGGMFAPPPPPGEPKGDIRKFMESIGIDWLSNEVVWDTYNPHTDLKELDREIVFVGPGGGNPEAFHPGDAISSGLQEMVFLAGGHMRSRPSLPLEFTPLIRTTRLSGAFSYHEVWRAPQMFGGGGLNPNRLHRPGGVELTVAARVRGSIPAEAPQDGKPADPPGNVHAVLIADVDFIHEQFFMIRRQAVRGWNFDNVTFVLNCVDALAGDESYVALRKRRPRHRTLEKLEALTKTHEDKRLKETDEAERLAKAELDKAQEDFDKRVKQVEGRTDLDERQKEIVLETERGIAQRRLDLARARVEDDKKGKIDRSHTTMREAIRAIQRRIKVFAVVLSPMPAIVVGLVVLMIRFSREQKAAASTPKA